MAINWGSTVGGESAAGREARAIDSRGGDVKYTYDVNGDPVAETVAATATGGRTEREYARRGDDIVYTYDENGAPVAVAVEDGRTSREYVDAATGDSARNGRDYAVDLAAAITAATAAV